MPHTVADDASERKGDGSWELAVFQSRDLWRKGPFGLTPRGECEKFFEFELGHVFLLLGVRAGEPYGSREQASTTASIAWPLGKHYCTSSIPSNTAPSQLDRNDAMTCDTYIGGISLGSVSSGPHAVDM
jgi:hypothetical protein